MESAPGIDQFAVPPPAPLETFLEERPHKSNLGRDAEMFPRRLEWISVILFIVGFLVMLESYSLYVDEKAWGISMLTVSVITNALFLLSIIFSIFGLRKPSQITLAIGLLGMIVTVTSLGVRLMQTLNEYDTWY